MKEEILARLQNALDSSVGLFREGTDHAGLDELLHSVEDLEIVLDAYPGEASLPIDAILPAYRKLLEYMWNRDITGMTDLLEFTICPLWMEQAGRCGTVCR